MRILRWALAAVVTVAVVIVLWNQGNRVIAGDTPVWASYLVIALLVFGDAIFPVLPGETTLNAGAILAAQGKLAIVLVVLCGAVGAVLGDSCVYWIARTAKGRVRRWLNRVGGSKSMTKVLGMLRERGPVFLLFGRYIPGVRFAMNAALGGVVHMPYRRFLMWSAISGTMWSIFTCVSAYYIGSALDGYPVLSLVATCVVTTCLISAIIWVQRTWSRRLS